MNSYALSVSYKNDDNVATALNGMSFGTARIQQANGFGEIASQIERASSKVSTLKEKAIPDALGHVLYMEEQVHKCSFDPKAENIFGNADPDVMNSWIGVLAMFGLNLIQPFELVMQELDFSNARTKVEAAYKECFKEKNLLDDKEKIYLVSKKVQGSIPERFVPVAFLSDSMLLCPFVYIDPDAMKDVPWYIPENTEQRKPAKWNSLADDKYLEDWQRRKLIWWLDNVFKEINEAKQYNPRLEGAYKAARYVLSKKGKIQKNVTTPVNIRAELSGLQASANMVVNRNHNKDVLARLLNVPDFSTRPPQVFTDRIFLVPKAKMGNSIVPDGVDPLMLKDVSIGGMNFNFGVLVPLTYEMTRWLQENRDNVQLVELNLEQIPGKESLSIRATIKFKIDEILITRERVWDGAESIYCAQNFYSTSLWPYFRASHPGSEDNLWKKYYVTLCDWTVDYSQELLDESEWRKLGDIKSSEGFVTLIDPLQQEDILQIYKKDEDKNISATKVKEELDENEKTVWKWRTITYSDFPEYINFCVNDQEVGCLYLKAPEVQEIGLGKKMIVAIDFGTTNTTCRARNMSDSSPVSESVILHEPKFVRELSSFNHEAIIQESKNFAQYYWFNYDQSSVAAGMIRTIAQLYTGNSFSQSPPLSGRAILTGKDGEVMAHFMRGKGNLCEHGLYTDIKLDEMNDTANKNAALNYIGYLQITSSLYAMSRGCDEIDFVYSYPDSRCYSHIKGIWTASFPDLKKFVDIKLQGECSDIKLYRECDAAAAYIKEQTGKFRPSDEVGYCIVDIGGGTTDISVWRRLDGDKSTSLLQKGSIYYAGNKILAESVYIVAQKYAEEFLQLWDLTEEKNNHRLNVLSAKLKDIPSGANQETELYALGVSRAAIVNTILESYDFSSRIDWDNIIDNVAKCLNVQIQVKTVLLFYIIASYISAADGIRFKGEKSASYHIQLAGGGSRILELCGKEFQETVLKNIFVSKCNGQMSDGIVLPSRFKINRRLDSSMKVEVADGLLNIICKEQKENGTEVDTSGKYDKLEKSDFLSGEDKYSDYQDKIFKAYDDLLSILDSSKYKGDRAKEYSFFMYPPKNNNIRNLLEDPDKDIFSKYFEDLHTDEYPRSVVPDIIAALALNETLNERLLDD